MLEVALEAALAGAAVGAEGNRRASVRQQFQVAARLRQGRLDRLRALVPAHPRLSSGISQTVDVGLIEPPATQEEGIREERRRRLIDKDRQLAGERRDVDGVPLPHLDDE